MPNLHIKRGNDWSGFEVRGRNLTLLEALYQCRSKDPTLRFRSSCGAGMCGSCAVQLDGRPVLACKTELGEGDHWVEPLPGFEVVKDLEVDKKRIYDEERELLSLMPKMDDTWDLMERSSLKIKPFHACLRCGICTSACTTRDMDWGAGSRMRIASYIVDSKSNHILPLPPSKAQKKLRGVYDDFRSLPQGSHELYRHMLICSACGRCEEFCPKGYKNKVQVLELAKERLYEEGASPIHTKLLGYYPMHNAYGEPQENRLAWLPPDVKFSEKPEVALFIGCTASYRRMESALALVKLLQWLKVPFTIPTGERCCGSSFLRAGVGKRAKRDFMPWNVDLLAGTKASVVLTPCAGCARTFNKDYPVFQGHMPFEVMHITQWLAESVEDGLKLPYVGGKATYHDSCHLGRGMGVYDAPRKIIEAMGIELVEMEFSRENSHCCGGGGGMRSGFKDLSLQIAGKRVGEAEQTGADTILSACVFCSTNLNDASEARGSKMKTRQIETVLAEAIRRD